MNPLATEIQEALKQIQESLAQGKTLKAEDMQLLFLTSLVAEVSSGER